MEIPTKEIYQIFPEPKEESLTKKKENLLVIMPNHHSGSKRYENPPIPTNIPQSKTNAFHKNQNPISKNRKKIIFFTSSNTRSSCCSSKAFLFNNETSTNK